MNDNPRYYWIKKRTDFYSRQDIKLLSREKKRLEYVYLFETICLMTANSGGKLQYKVDDDYYDFTIEDLKIEANWIDEETIVEGLALLMKYKMILVDENGVKYIANYDDMVGSEASNANAQRQKRFRERKKKSVTNSNDNNNDSNNDNDVTNNNEDIKRLDKRDKEIRDKEKEIDTEIEIINPAKQDNIPYHEIIDYLNERAGTNYKYTSNKTRDCIKARFNEGFILDDFKRVIDIKVLEWKNTTMEKYIRPETLFSNKFEGYLNQKVNFSTKDLGNFMNWEDMYDESTSLR